MTQPENQNSITNLQFVLLKNHLATLRTSRLHLIFINLLISRLQYLEFQKKEEKRETR